MNLVSLSSVTTEILFALEQGERIVCTDVESDYPEEAKDLPKLEKIVSGALFEAGAELVFTCGKQQEQLAEELRAADLQVVHHSPQSINEIYEMIRAFGLLLQIDQEAEGVVLQMQQGLNDVKKKAGLLPERLKIKTDPEYPWIAEVIRIGGGESVEGADAIRLDELCNFSLLKYPSPRLVEGARRIYSMLFEKTH